MENILVKLIVIVALAQSGITLHDFLNCRNRACKGQVEKASRKVLNMDWKPIRVFPNEARRFR